MIAGNQINLEAQQELMARVEALHGSRDLHLLTFPEALFIARSVAHFAILAGRSAGFAEERLTEALWCSAANEILMHYDALTDCVAMAPIFALRAALCRVSLDGAVRAMVDGLDALRTGHLEQAAVVGAEAWVHDGKAQDLIGWLAERGRVSPELQYAGRTMDLIAWALHEVSQYWCGTRAELGQFARGVNRAGDWLLLRDASRKTMVSLMTLPPLQGH